MKLGAEHVALCICSPTRHALHVWLVVIAEGVLMGGPPKENL